MTRNNREKRINLPEGDDGRSFANMNVEGMPWYKPEREDVPQFPSAGKGFDNGLSRREMRMYTMGALKAALLVTLVMCLGIVLFVAFCVFVWFR